MGPLAPTCCFKATRRVVCQSHCQREKGASGGECRLRVTESSPAGIADRSSFLYASTIGIMGPFSFAASRFTCHRANRYAQAAAGFFWSASGPKSLFANSECRLKCKPGKRSAGEQEAR